LEAEFREKLNCHKLDLVTSSPLELSLYPQTNLFFKKISISKLTGKKTAITLTMLTQ